MFQSVLENSTFSYDVVDNPIAITDGRNPSEWPTSFKPSTRHFQYDDLYRLKRVEYVSGDDDWTSPYAAENADPTGRTEPSPHVSFAKRVQHQTFAYDALGNTTTTDDDAHGFYDRSLGAITNGTATAGPYQLKQATQSTGGSRDGSLSAAYDDAGQLTSLAVRRNGPCIPAGAVCSQRFVYEWDEVGNLTRARRWDLASPGAATDPLPNGAPAAELRYTYAGGERVLKTAVDASGSELHTVYIFGSLELRRATFENGDYERTSATMAPYLGAGGAWLARLYYSEEDLPTLTSGHLHVLFELADHLGSSSFVIDKATSELVEATRYEAYGSTESDYRPERWKAYREDHRFTGKEEDIEVGLTYFGARYYSPALNRWTSADPLAVHAPGEADLNLYAYVHGRVLRAVDPLGLVERELTGASGYAADGQLYMSGMEYTVDKPSGDATTSPAPTSPDAPTSSPATPATPMGHGFAAAAEAEAGDYAGAAKSLATGAADIAGRGIPQSPVPGALEAGAKIWDAGTSGGLRAAGREYGRQLLQRTPVVGPAKRAIDAAARARATTDRVEKAAATGDAIAEGTQAGVDLAGMVASARAAVRGPKAPPSPAPPKGVCFTAGTLVMTSNGMVAIERLRVGDHVVTNSDESSGQTAVNPSTWRDVMLEMPDPAGSDDVLRIEVLRPVAWLQAVGAEERRWIELSLPEMGLHGPALVTEVRPAPPIQPDAGRVVLSTVTSQSNSVVVLRFEGQVAPLEPTAGHRFFSLDRQSWVAAIDLVEGEHLLAHSGPVRLWSVEQKPGVHRVYNIEVETKHSYLVGNAGVLSHNVNPCAAWTPPKITVNPRGQLTNGRYTLDAPGMAPHKTGSLAAGKSQWLSNVYAEKAVLDAAAKADAEGLWVGNKAKVPGNAAVGVLGSSGELTSWINVYRTRTGFVHGAPGTPR